MNPKIQLLKQKVSQLSKDKSFVHYKWYLKYHLDLVEKVSLEISKNYEVDLDLLLGLVWIHDYAKLIGVREDTEVLERSREFILSIGFENEYTQQVIAFLEMFESKMSTDLSNAPVEVKIVSSADGVSHMVGPFYQMYCYENPEISVEQLMESNMAKLDKDWERKIVLPEVKEAMQQRYDFLRESFGNIPEKILS